MSLGAIATVTVMQRNWAVGGSYKLPAYSLHNAALELSSKNWKTTVYADNLFNAFIETSARRNANYNQVVSDINASLIYQRGFFTIVLPPRRIGVRFEYQFNAA
jgi:outer membrane receptor protein involved in Fe transport